VGQAAALVIRQHESLRVARRSEGGRVVAGPTQQLVLEVLAARSRLGENAWTFASRLRPVLEALEQAGLVWWKHATIPGHCLAGLTAAGRAAVLVAGYTVPGEITIEWGARHGFGDDEKVRNFGSGDEARKISRMIAADYAAAGQLGRPVVSRVVRERWSEYPDDWAPPGDGPDHTERCTL
jgi:hypothetical protein